MPAGIYVTTKDLMILHGYQRQKSASHLLGVIRDCLGKKKYQKITIREYCSYQGVSEEEIKEALCASKKI